MKTMRVFKQCWCFFTTLFANWTFQVFFSLYGLPLQQFFFTMEEIYVEKSGQSFFSIDCYLEAIKLNTHQVFKNYKGKSFLFFWNIYCNDSIYKCIKRFLWWSFFSVCRDFEINLNTLLAHSFELSSFQCLIAICQATDLSLPRHLRDWVFHRRRGLNSFWVFGRFLTRHTAGVEKASFWQ